MTKRMSRYRYFWYRLVLRVSKAIPLRITFYTVESTGDRFHPTQRGRKWSKAWGVMYLIRRKDLFRFEAEYEYRRALKESHGKEPGS